MALFGAVGAIVSEVGARSTGDDLQGEGGLHDPAGRIVGVLAAALSKKYALEVKGTRATITDATRPKAIVAAAPGADLVLHVSTSQWGFGPASASHYGIVYDGTLTLIDARSGARVAEGICSFRPVDAGDAPTYDQMMANDAAVLREMVDAVTESCIDDYRKRILGIYQ